MILFSALMRYMVQVLTDYRAFRELYVILGATADCVSRLPFMEVDTSDVWVASVARYEDHPQVTSVLHILWLA